MPRKLKAGSDKSETVSKLPEACSDELKAVEFLEKQRWGDHPSCPNCGSLEVTKLRAKGTNERNARFLWKCRGKGCTRRQFTVRVGTVLEDSRVPLRHWCYAFWAACASKKGVSALQIKRQTGLTYKSALFLMHRIRHAMADEPIGKLSGTVEVDETYVGGRPRYKGGRKAQGRYRDYKTPVVGLVQRGGELRARPIPRLGGKVLREIIEESVDPSAKLMTDELPAYRPIGRDFADHGRVMHSVSEYVRGDAHVNTLESFFGLLKRGIYGTYHSVSKQHLHRYVSEFVFRYNTRKLDDGERTVQAIRRADGKRLWYRDPVQGEKAAKDPERPDGAGS